MKIQDESGKLRAQLPYNDHRLAQLHHHAGLYYERDEYGRYWWYYESLKTLIEKEKAHGMRPR